jgi:hypothetical protein
MTTASGHWQAGLSGDRKHLKVSFISLSPAPPRSPDSNIGQLRCGRGRVDDHYYFHSIYAKMDGFTML